MLKIVRIFFISKGQKYWTIFSVIFGCERFWWPGSQNTAYEFIHVLVEVYTLKNSRLRDVFVFNAIKCCDNNPFPFMQFDKNIQLNHILFRWVI